MSPDCTSAPKKTENFRGRQNPLMLDRLIKKVANAAAVDSSCEPPIFSITVGYPDLKSNILKLEYMRTLIGILPNLAYLKDTETQQYVYINEGFNRSFSTNHFSEPNIISQKIVECELKAIQLGEEIVNQKISPVVNPDGSISELMLNFYPISIESKERKYLLCYGYDITRSISSNALCALYKEHYSDEKEALFRFFVAIGLDHYLDGQRLSPREFDCLIMLAKGLSAKEIARALSISNRTVENHLMNIKEKFSVRSNIELLSIFLACYRQEN
jgi:DNA-binding CsgD family transcriptional regulator